MITFLLGILWPSTEYTVSGVMQKPPYTTFLSPSKTAYEKHLHCIPLLFLLFIEKHFTYHIFHRTLQFRFVTFYKHISSHIQPHKLL